MTRPRVELLTAMVRELNEGRSIPCHVDPDPFTSDAPEERAEAAFACRPCPVLIECGTFALLNEERAHVWGSVDLTPRPGPAQPRRALARLLDIDTKETA